MKVFILDKSALTLAASLLASFLEKVVFQSLWMYAWINFFSEKIKNFLSSWIKSSNIIMNKLMRLLTNTKQKIWCLYKNCLSWEILRKFFSQFAEACNTLRQEMSVPSESPPCKRTWEQLTTSNVDALYTFIEEVNLHIFCIGSVEQS